MAIATKASQREGNVSEGNYGEVWSKTEAMIRSLRERSDDSKPRISYPEYYGSYRVGRENEGAKGNKREW